jgi:hypothetical protein
MYLLHRRNSLDSVRPDLILDGWEIDDDAKTYHIVTLRNVGKGPAIQVAATTSILDDNEQARNSAIGLFDVRLLPVIAAGQDVAVNWRLWVPRRDGFPIATRIRLTVWCTDLHGRRHDFDNDLQLFLNCTIDVTNVAKMAPGLFSLRRTIRVTSKLRDRFSTYRQRLSYRWATRNYVTGPANVSHPRIATRMAKFNTFERPDDAQRADPIPHDDPEPGKRDSPV